MRRWVLAVLMAFGLVTRTALAAEDSNRADVIMRAAEDQIRIATALRGDGELTVESPENSVRSPVVVIYRPGKAGVDVYIELKRDGTKALILDNGERAFRLGAGASAAEPFGGDLAFAESEFTREDLQPFRAAEVTQAQISDESSARVTITYVPKPSQYSLKVVTVDAERKLPLKTLYYRDTTNNMVKMRRDNNYVAVGQIWLPSEITMEDFKLRTQSTLTLKWSQNPTISAGLFDPAALARPSGLAWPEQQSAGGVAQ
ncbi:MAG TPA: outer membrane lipoprotein-sorting protein [Candidatus Binatia bacterium]|nr:outer membrane lipoprotein-sorting protein [Candidatus Binatia bacterium]